MSSVTLCLARGCTWITDNHEHTKVVKNKCACFLKCTCFPISVVLSYFNFRGFFWIYFFTGELIGVEYLFAQTGKVLQLIPEAEDAEPTAEIRLDEDEGFEASTYFSNNVKKRPKKTTNNNAFVLLKQDDTEVEDQTVAVPQPRVPQPQPEPEPEPDQEPEAKLPPPVNPREHSTVPKEREQQHSPADSSGSSDEENTVGLDNIGRYVQVVALAEHLATLKDLQGALTNQQAAVII